MEAFKSCNLCLNFSSLYFKVEQSWDARKPLLLSGFSCHSLSLSLSLSPPTLGIAYWPSSCHLPSQPPTKFFTLARVESSVLFFNISDHCWLGLPGPFLSSHQLFSSALSLSNFSTCGEAGRSCTSSCCSSRSSSSINLSALSVLKIRFFLL